MSELINKLKETVSYIKEHTKELPEVGIVLGTGLSPVAKDIVAYTTINYEDLPHFPVSTVQSHAGKLIIGKWAGKTVIAFQGRFHYYEGYSTKELTYPIRLAGYLGATHMLFSNAAGGVKEGMEIGDIMIFNDHINLVPENPLRGENEEELGPRFPDMSDVYDKAMIAVGIKAGSETKSQIHEGVYTSLPGPSLETRAEYRMVHRMGGDAIGLSTVPEVIVAKHMGMKCFGVSVICNIGYPPERVVEVSVEEIIEAAEEATPAVIHIIRNVVESI